jgi:hypothetical protein
VQISKRDVVITLIAFGLASACDRGRMDTSRAPTSTPSSVPPFQIVLTGQVTDSATAAPIAGAVVSINGRYRGATDASGNYSVAGFMDYGNFNFTYVSAAGYESDYRYIRTTSQNVRLHPIERITAGESWLVTVATDDSLCVNNVQDSPGIGPGYLCGTVRVVSPIAGTLTVDVTSIVDGSHPLVEVETVDINPCCSERLENPTSIQVQAGAQVVVHVETGFSSTTRQSFMVKTALTAEK